MSICPPWAKDEFRRCSPWLQSALDKTLGEYALEHVWNYIESGRAQIWPTPNACMVTVVEDYPTGLRTIKCWLAGGRLSELMPLLNTIENYGRKAGCHKAVIVGRRGWIRQIPGCRERYTIVAKDL